MINRNESRKGMSLVEITIVLVVLLVIFGAVFLFFTRGTEHFEFSRRQNELITIGRMALEEVTDEIIYAGYMPMGGWDNDEWHPVVAAEDEQFEFYADWDGSEKPLINSDYRLVSIVNESFQITDRAGDVNLIGSNITSFDLGYLDEMGNPLPEPLDSLDRDLVRHVQISIVLSDTWGSQTYDTELHTTISPRNLGVNHNINPAFWPPPELEGLIAFNVPGTGETHDPNEDELLMINKMLFWGLSVIQLNDDEMATFDFIGEGVTLIVLRHRDAGGVFPHPGVLNNPLAAPLEVPVVTLNARDAVDIFSMGSSFMELSNERMTAANTWHPVNEGLPQPDSTFYQYIIGSGGLQSVVDNLIYNSPGDTVLTYSDSVATLSGVCVRDEATFHRRVHFSSYDASEYTTPYGWRLFYNVIQWSLGIPPEEYGDVLEKEDFEDPEDYGGALPTQVSNAYCYVVSPSVTLPAMTDASDSVILRFSHWYWFVTIQTGGFIEFSTDSLNWDMIHECDVYWLSDGYNENSGPHFKAGFGVPIFTNQLHPGHPNAPDFTWESINLDSLRGQDIWVRFVFGSYLMKPENKDGWLIDDLEVILSSDHGSGVVEERIDTWGDNIRFWHHYEFAPWADCWWYNDLHSCDPIFPYEQGYAWTTWGPTAYIGPWQHGGTNDTWEIGVITNFWPDPDPEPVFSIVGNHYVGTALTINEGEYNSLETSWLLSERYEMAPTLDYEIIRLGMLKCLRVAPADDVFIHFAFSDSLIPPPRDSLDQWVEVFQTMGVNEDYFEFEVMDVSEAFKEDGDGMTYYWILFSIISSPNVEWGGWNLDNIYIYGANII